MTDFMLISGFKKVLSMSSAPPGIEAWCEEADGMEPQSGPLVALALVEVEEETAPGHSGTFERVVGVIAAEDGLVAVEEGDKSGYREKVAVVL